MALESIESPALESIESPALESLESLALESVGLGSLAPVRELLLEGSVQISAQLDTAEALGLCIGVILLVLEEAAQAPA